MIFTAEEQTHVDRVKLLAKTIRQTKHDGRHDGLGNPVIGVDLYYAWALEACDSIDWVINRASQGVKP